VVQALPVPLPFAVIDDQFDSLASISTPAPAVLSVTTFETEALRCRLPTVKPRPAGVFDATPIVALMKMRLAKAGSTAAAHCR